jgi:hypothetical protein
MNSLNKPLSMSEELIVSISEGKSSSGEYRIMGYMVRVLVKFVLDENFG